MSISNWDIFSKDSYGKSTEGVYYPSGPHKPRVEIYKNWLYLYTGDLLVGSLEEGKATFCGVDIYATRGPQDGVYVIVQDSIRPWVVGKPCAQCGEAVNSLHIDCEHDFETQYVAWVGCGVYGYPDDDRFIGVTQESLEYLRSIMDSNTIYNFSFDKTEYSKELFDIKTRGADKVVIQGDEITVHRTYPRFLSEVRDIDLTDF